MATSTLATSGIFPCIVSTSGRPHLKIDDASRKGIPKTHPGTSKSSQSGRSSAASNSEINRPDRPSHARSQPVMSVTAHRSQHHSIGITIDPNLGSSGQKHVGPICNPI
ncbi:hypothetical protein ACLOJK_022917 [Asimina triloba]